MDFKTGSIVVKFLSTQDIENPKMGKHLGNIIALSILLNFHFFTHMHCAHIKNDMNICNVYLLIHIQVLLNKLKGNDLL